MVYYVILEKLCKSPIDIITVTPVSSGSHSNMSEGSSRSSQEGLDSLQGDARQLVQRTQISLGVPECSSHPPVMRVCSSPQAEVGRRRLQLSLNPMTPYSEGQSAASSTEDLPQGSGHQVSPALFTPRLTPIPASQQTQPAALAAHRHPLQSRKPTPQRSSNSADAMVPMSPEWQDWQRDRWQIWQLLSSDNADTLPETLV